MVENKDFPEDFVETDLIMDKISNAGSKAEKSDDPFRFSVGKNKTKYNNTPLTRAKCCRSYTKRLVLRLSLVFCSLISLISRLATFT